MMHLCNPLLPKAETLLPYLKRIDESRWYSNSGPLVKEYEHRISNLFGGRAVAVASGTAGLIAALSGLGLKGEAILPGWTFVATANAAKAVGCTHFFADVHSETWQIVPSMAVLGVSPFGAPVSGKYMLVDGAAAFDTYSASGISRVGREPVVISTHATKCFSTGEGGLVLTTDKVLEARVREIINHGITLDRDVPAPGINGKMSEYHAAIGLASLDCWPETRQKWLTAKIRYMSAFDQWSPSFNGPNPIFDSSWVGPSFGIDIKRKAGPVAVRLAKKGITARKIWGPGVHRYPAYSHCPRSPMPVTERLADEVLFLPFWVDATENEIKFIADSVRDALA